jgi:hypothetical protein
VDFYRILDYHLYLFYIYLLSVKVPPAFLCRKPPRFSATLRRPVHPHQGGSVPRGAICRDFILSIGAGGFNLLAGVIYGGQPSFRSGLHTEEAENLRGMLTPNLPERDDTND